MDIPASDFWSAATPATGRDWQTDNLHIQWPHRAHAEALYALHAPRLTPRFPRTTPTPRLPLSETGRLKRTEIIGRREYGFTQRDIMQTMTKQTGMP